MTSKFVCSYSLLSQTQDAHSLQFTELKYTGVSNIPLSQGKVLPQNICGVSENYYIKLNIRNQLIIFWSIKQPQDGFFFFFFDFKTTGSKIKRIRRNLSNVNHWLPRYQSWKIKMCSSTNSLKINISDDPINTFRGRNKRKEVQSVSNLSNPELDGNRIL